MASDQAPKFDTRGFRWGPCEASEVVVAHCDLIGNLTQKLGLKEPKGSRKGWWLRHSEARRGGGVERGVEVEFVGTCSPAYGKLRKLRMQDAAGFPVCVR